MSKAVVLLSGGADSTICAAIAQADHSEVHAVTIDYNQRHAIEIESARQVAKVLGLASHTIVNLGAVLKGSSPLVSDNSVDEFSSADNLPSGMASTFVPNRNAVLLMVAANQALAIGCNTIYTGVCETDFSGYPDCRRVFIDSIEQAIGLGNDANFKIITPLMNINKAESVLLAQNLMGDRFTEVMRLTHTCYQGVRGGCGKCAACLLRDRGFQEAAVDDPIWVYRGT